MQDDTSLVPQDSQPTPTGTVCSTPLDGWVDSLNKLHNRTKFPLNKIQNWINYSSFPKYLVNGKIWFDPVEVAFWALNNRKIWGNKHYNELNRDPSLQEDQDPSTNTDEGIYKGKNITNFPPIIKAKAKTYSYQARMAKLEYAKRSGRLIDSQLWQEDEATRLQIYKDTMMRLPVELAAKVESQSIESCQSIIREAINEKMEIIYKQIIETPVNETIPEFDDDEKEPLANTEEVDK